MLEAQDRALSINPFDATMLATRGWSLQTLGRVDDALSNARRAREVAPDNPMGYYVAGLVYFDAIGDIGEAARWFDRARDVDRADPELLAWAAYAYLTLGDLSRAIGYAEEALERNPANSSVLATRALVYVFQGDEPAALSLARRGLEPGVVDRFGGRLILLRILRANWLREGQVEDAIGAYESAYPTVARAEPIRDAPLDHAEFGGWGEVVGAAIDLAHLRMVAGDTAGAQVLIRLVREELTREPHLQFLRFFGPGTADAKLLILEQRNADALGSLEQVVDGGWLANWRYEIEYDPIFDPVRNEPGYRRIIEKLEAATLRQRK